MKKDLFCSILWTSELQKRHSPSLFVVPVQQHPLGKVFIVSCSVVDIQLRNVLKWYCDDDVGMHDLQMRWVDHDHHDHNCACVSTIKKVVVAGEVWSLLALLWLSLISMYAFQFITLYPFYLRHYLSCSHSCWWQAKGKDVHVGRSFNSWLVS